jgi:hypothetical protein
VHANARNRKTKLYNYLFFTGAFEKIKQEKNLLA